MYSSVYLAISLKSIIGESTNEAKVCLIFFDLVLDESTETLPCGYLIMMCVS